MLSNRKNKDFQHVNITDVKSAEDLMLISASSAFAEFASVNWLIKVRSPELRRLLGKSQFYIIFFRSFLLKSKVQKNKGLSG